MPGGAAARGLSDGRAGCSQHLRRGVERYGHVRRGIPDALRERLRGDRNGVRTSGSHRETSVRPAMSARDGLRIDRERNRGCRHLVSTAATSSIVNRKQISTAFRLSSETLIPRAFAPDTLHDSMEDRQGSPPAGSSHRRGRERAESRQNPAGNSRLRLRACRSGAAATLPKSLHESPLNARRRCPRRRRTSRCAAGPLSARPQPQRGGARRLRGAPPPARALAPDPGTGTASPGGGRRRSEARGGRAGAAARCRGSPS